LLPNKGATPDKGADDQGASAEAQPIQRQHSASRTERLSAAGSPPNEAVELTNLNDLIRFV